MRIALINNQVVFNIIEADIAFAQSLGFDAAVQADDAVGIGWLFDGSAFAAPAPAPAPVTEQPVTTMTKLTFMRRFSPEQRIALREAAKTDPILDDAQRLLDWAQDVDVADTDTQQLVGYLAQIGIIAPDDVVRILAPLGA